MAQCQALGHVLHGRGQARLRRGGARRSPADELQPLARRAPARARAGAVARSVQLPARGQAALEPRRLAVRIRVLAAPGGARDGARVERVRPARLPRRGRLHGALAPGGRNATRSVARGRARVRDGAVPPGAVERGPPPGVDRDAPAPVPVRARAGEEGIGLVARPGRRRARLDPALGPAPPCARSDPVLRRVRARPIALGRTPGRARARRGTARGRARRERHDRGERPPVPAGRALLREPCRTSSRATRTRSKGSSTSAGRSRCSPSPGSSRSSCAVAGGSRSCSGSAR